MTHFNAVSLPGLAPQVEHRDAREEARDEEPEAAALVQVLGVPVLQAGKATGAAEACEEREMHQP